MIETCYLRQCNEYRQGDGHWQQMYHGAAFGFLGPVWRDSCLICKGSTLPLYEICALCIMKGQNVLTP